jgi:hypothetical protein
LGGKIVIALSSLVQHRVALFYRPQKYFAAVIAFSSPTRFSSLPRDYLSVVIVDVQITRTVHVWMSFVSGLYYPVNVCSARQATGISAAHPWSHQLARNDRAITPVVSVCINFPFTLI